MAQCNQLRENLVGSPRNTLNAPGTQLNASGNKVNASGKQLNGSGRDLMPSAVTLWGSETFLRCRSLSPSPQTLYSAAMRRFYALLFFALTCLGHAAPWSDESHGCQANLPDGPGWQKI